MAWEIILLYSVLWRLSLRSARTPSVSMKTLNSSYSSINQVSALRCYKLISTKKCLKKSFWNRNLKPKHFFLSMLGPPMQILVPHSVSLKSLPSADVWACVQEWVCVCASGCECVWEWVCVCTVQECVKDREWVTVRKFEERRTSKEVYVRLQSLWEREKENEEEREFLLNSHQKTELQ